MISWCRKIAGQPELVLGLTPQCELEEEFCKVLTEAIAQGGKILVTSGAGRAALRVPTRLQNVIDKG